MREPSPRPRPSPAPAPQESNGPSALGAASLTLVAVAAGVLVWLALSGPPEPREPAYPLVVKLTPLPQPEAAPQAGAAALRPDAPGEAAPAPNLARDDSPPAAPEDTGAPPERNPAEAVGSAAATEEETGPGEAPPPVQQVAALPRSAVPAIPPVPDPELLERTGIGPLPRISPDGRTPWRTYARPFTAGDRRPRIAIILAGLGLSGAATEAAIQRLPGPVTLSFAPYAKDLDRWIGLARAAGHEVMLDLPMEPVTFPAHHPGPHTLMTTLSEDQNLARLHWLLGRVTGYVGMVNHMGSRFTTSEEHVRPILTELNKRGLLFVDTRSSLRSVAARLAGEIGLPRAVNNRFIDAEASREAIDGRLGELERIARSSGHAVGIASPFPVTIDRLAAWIQDISDRDMVLAPVSALVATRDN